MMSFNLIAASVKNSASQVGGGEQTYSTEATASFTNFAGAEEPNTTEKNAVARFIDNQVRLGNWARIKEIQLNSGLSTAAKAAIGLKQGITANYNGCAYTPTGGVETDGVSKYVNTNLVPSTLGSSLNDAGYSFWMTDNLGFARAAVIGTNSSHMAYMTIDTATGAFTGNTNSGTGYSFNNTKFSYDNNLYTMYRASATLSSAYYNGQYLGGTGTQNSAGVPDRPFYLGATNNNGTAQFFNAGKYGAFCVHDAVNFDIQGFYYHLNILMQELGVKPKEELYPLDMVEPTYSATDAMLIHSEGQSNSLFAGKATDLSPYPSLQAPIPGANIFWMPTLGGNVTLETLDYGANHNNEGNMAEFAGGLRMAKELADIGQLKQYIWEYGRSATFLKETVGTKDWNVDSVNELEWESRTYVGAKGLPLVAEPIKKIVWHWNQGEGDASENRTEAEYTTDWYKLLKSRIDFYEAEGLDLSVSKLHIMIHKIYSGNLIGGASEVGRNAVRAAQENFSIANFEAAYPAYAGKITSMITYNTDDLVRTDEVHLISQGYHLEGHKVANYISRL